MGSEGKAKAPYDQRIIRRDGSPVSGRGWAALGTAGRLVGHIFIHKGDD